MRWTSLCRTTSSPVKWTKSMSRTPPRISRTTTSPERWSSEIDLGDVPGDHHLRVEPEARQEHLHLVGRGVLSLVENDERLIERAAPHECQRRHLDHAPLEVGVDALGVEHVVEGVEERAQIRIDLLHHRAGQKAEPLARFDRRPSEDDPVHGAARERGGCHRHREVGLAGAGRPDPERDVSLRIESTYRF